MKKIITFGLLLLLWATLGSPVSAQAAQCPGLPIKSAQIKDSDGFLPSPSISLQTVNFTGAGLPSATAFQNMITPGGSYPTSFTYVGIKDGNYVFRWPQYFNLDTGKFKVFPPIAPGAFPTNVSVVKPYGFVVQIPTNSLTTGTDGKNIIATLQMMEWFQGSAGADLGPSSDAGMRSNCTLPVNEDIGKDLQASVQAATSGGTGMANHDVGGTLNASDSTVNPDDGTCGKPTLKNIIPFAFCNLLDSLITFLKSLI